MDIQPVFIDNDGNGFVMEDDRRKHMDHLTGEHRLGDAGQLIFAVLFLIVWVADTFFLRLTTVFPGYIPWFLRIPLGLAVGALGYFVAARGMSQIFSKNEPASGVVRTGVFSRVRHPIYLAEILLYFGLLVISPSLAGAAVMLAAAVFLYVISRYEEKLLLQRFGADYADYMKAVPMWFPRIR